MCSPDLISPRSAILLNVALQGANREIGDPRSPIQMQPCCRWRCRFQLRMGPRQQRRRIWRGKQGLCGNGGERPRGRSEKRWGTLSYSKATAEIEVWHRHKRVGLAERLCDASHVTLGRFCEVALRLC